MICRADTNVNTRTKNQGNLWAITCYFNPVGYRRRLENYRTFRQHLNVPLITVEMSFRDEFELRDTDAEILVRLRGRDILWQKERLLNEAMKAVPSDCDKIAWLDSDIIFSSPDWTIHACQQLARCHVVQLFDHSNHLPKHIHRTRQKDQTPIRCERAVAAWLANYNEPQPRGNLPKDMSWGLAWAAQRWVIDKHRFYDACILGGGDAAMVLACYGWFDLAIDALRMNTSQMDHYLAWAKPLYNDVGANVGYIEQRVSHLWHGEREDRRYSARHDDFARFEFDPSRDMTVDRNGCWCWNSENRAMHTYVRDYFVSRNEDGNGKHPRAVANDEYNDSQTRPLSVAHP